MWWKRGCRWRRSSLLGASDVILSGLWDVETDCAPTAAWPTLSSYFGTPARQLPTAVAQCGHCSTHHQWPKTPPFSPRQSRTRSPMTNEAPRLRWLCSLSFRDLPLLLPRHQDLLGLPLHPSPLRAILRACDRESCNARTHQVSIRIQLSRLGIPLSMVVGGGGGKNSS